MNSSLRRLAQAAVEPLFIQGLLELGVDHIRTHRLAVVRVDRTRHRMQQGKRFLVPVHSRMVAPAADGKEEEEGERSQPDCP